ncbi:MAG: radical SAM protein [Bacilli bacterium]|nr:radical SAM protein [Bacilli bacterium]
MLDELNECKLCPKNCKVNRNNNKFGFCKASNKVKIARAALHYYEEPCISGNKGSGTIFFSCCNMKCVYCQNYKISTKNYGKEVTIERLCEIFLELQEKGALNINLVTPTPYVPQIIEALKLAKANGLNIPIVYNTSSYENVETIKMLDGYVDIYLADVKYFDNNYGLKYSNVNNYFYHASMAIDAMVSQIKENQFDENGIMKKGIIIRHMIIPGLSHDSKKILKYLYDKYKDKIYISIMNQYTPLEHVRDYPELNKTLTNDEYDDVVNYAIELGISNGFIQEGETASESFIPNFDNEGI